MRDIKINLTMYVPGASFGSEQEYSKLLKKPIIVKNGKYKGKQAIDKNGNLLWKFVTVPDLDKMDRHELKIRNGVGPLEPIVFYTRKPQSAKKVVNLAKEAYNYFISDEVPQGYRAPKDFVPYAPTRPKRFTKGIPLHVQAWRSLDKTQRLEWHLDNYCKNFGGTLKSYVVFDD